jgi:UDP-N-acetyl-D-mannosaminuronic acid transferase (WecB/TagA/CpsF family)
MASSRSSNRTILGVDFFQGTVGQAVNRMKDGGLLVVPAAPALKDIDTREGYRRALLNADLVLADSAFMVLIWNRLQNDSITRISGLEYLHALLQQPEMRRSGDCVWVMPDPESAERNWAWLKEQGIFIPRDHLYVAPLYGEVICDEALLGMLERLKPKNVIVTIGGGTQERLGYYLKTRLSYLPAIHCIGAAIAFLSGAQVRIPMWADRMYLGWLFRSLSEPGRYIPRYWGARKLLGLMRRYRERLPISSV